jgi:hypothetical protein
MVDSRLWPISSEQRRLWFLDHWASARIAWNTSVAFEEIQYFTAIPHDSIECFSAIGGKLGNALDRPELPIGQLTVADADAGDWRAEVRDLVERWVSLKAVASGRVGGTA